MNAARLLCAWRGLPDPFFIEWFSGGGLIGFGLFLALVPNALEQEVYWVLRGLAPTWAWMVSTFLVGSFQVITIYSHHRVFRMVGALAAGVMWAVLTVGIYQAHRKLPGIVIYASYPAMNMLTLALLFRRIP